GRKGGCWTLSIAVISTSDSRESIPTAIPSARSLRRASRVVDPVHEPCDFARHRRRVSRDHRRQVAWRPPRSACRAQLRRGTLRHDGGRGRPTPETGNSLPARPPPGLARRTTRQVRVGPTAWYTPADVDEQ